MSPNCLTVCDLETSTLKQCRPELVFCATKKNNDLRIFIEISIGFLYKICGAGMSFVKSVLVNLLFT